MAATTGSKFRKSSGPPRTNFWIRYWECTGDCTATNDASCSEMTTHACMLHIEPSFEIITHSDKMSSYKTWYILTFHKYRDCIFTIDVSRQFNYFPYFTKVKINFKTNDLDNIPGAAEKDSKNITYLDSDNAPAFTDNSVVEWVSI